ncbi:hypothetical protein Tco_0174411 [Tanacetum coccineum]
MGTSSYSIASKHKSPTSSTSPSTNSYLNSPISPPPRVPPPPPTQGSEPMDITLTLSPITPLDIQINTPSSSMHSPPLFGHPISWNLLEAHEATCLCYKHKWKNPNSTQARRNGGRPIDLDGEPVLFGDDPIPHPSGAPRPSKSQRSSNSSATSVSSKKQSTDLMKQKMAIDPTSKLE